MTRGLQVCAPARALVLMTDALLLTILAHDCCSAADYPCLLHRILTLFSSLPSAARLPLLCRLLSNLVAVVEVDGIVYNITPHIDNHPGWKEGSVSTVVAILAYLGSDATHAWHAVGAVHSTAKVKAELRSYRIGVLAGGVADCEPTPPLNATTARPATRLTSEWIWWLRSPQSVSSLPLPVRLTTAAAVLTWTAAVLLT